MKRWKRKIVFCMTFLLILQSMGGMTATAQEENETDTLLFRMDIVGQERGYVITGYRGDAAILTIPGTFQGEKVLKINEYAFAQNENLAKVILSDNIKEIGPGAFQDCSNLQYISFPKTMEHVGRDAFLGAASIEKFEIASLELMWNIVYDNNDACPLYAGTDVSLVITGDDFISMEGDATTQKKEESSESQEETEEDHSDFVWREYGTGVEITEYTGTSAEVSIPTRIEKKAVIRLGKETFSNHAALQSLTLPSTIQEIEAGCFDGCKHLLKVNVSDLNQYLKIVSQEGSNPLACTTEGKLYMNGWEISEVHLEEGISSIPENTFAHQGKLREISIPSTLKIIEKGAFTDCDQLSVLHIEDENQWNQMTMESVSANPLYQTEQFVTLKNNQNGYIKTLDYFPGTESIRQYAFSNTSIEKVSLPDQIKNLGEGAFYGCHNLKEVQLSEGMHEVKGHSFENCFSLEEISLPVGISRIEEDAFAGCQKLECVYMSIDQSYDLKEAAEIPGIHIDPEAFRGCGERTSGKDFFRPYPETVKTGTLPGSNILWKLMGKDTLRLYRKDPASGGLVPDCIQSPFSQEIFSDVSRVELVGIESLGKNILQGLPHVQTILLDTSCDLMQMGESCLPDYAMTLYYYNYGQTAETCLTYGKTHPNLRLQELYDAEGNMQHVRWTLREGILTFYSIGNGTSFLAPGEEIPVSFQKMDIRAVRFADGFCCKDLPEGLFRGCKRLYDIELADSIITLGKECFAGCESLQKVIYGSQLQEMGAGVFQGCSSLHTMVNTDVFYLDEDDQTIEKNLIDLPDSMTVIPECAFAGCESVEAVYSMPKDIRVEENAFMDCIRLENADFINNTQAAYLAGNAFVGCEALLVYSNSQDILKYCQQNQITCQELDEEDLIDAVEDAAKKKKTTVVKSKKKKVKKKSKRGSILCIGSDTIISSQFVKINLTRESVTTICNYCSEDHTVYISRIVLEDGLNCQPSPLKTGIYEGKITFEHEKADALTIHVSGNPQRLRAQYDEAMLSVSCESDCVTIQPKKSGGAFLLLYDAAKPQEEPLLLTVRVLQKKQQKIAVSSRQLVLKPTEEKSIQVTNVTGKLHAIPKDSNMLDISIQKGKILVKGKKAGKTSLTIYADPTMQALKSNTLEVTVIVTELQADVSSITLFAGEKRKVTLTGNYGNIKESSGNANIATVSNKVITAKKPGTATLTFQDDMTGQKVSTKVKVLQNPGGILKAKAVYKTGVKKAKSKAKNLKLSWKQYDSISKYQIQICRKKTFPATLTITKNFTNSKTGYLYKNGVKGKNYYVRMRYVYKGKYSKWSTVRKVIL